MDLNPNYCECGTKTSYADKYDVYYCNTCNKWLESKCNDPACEFCTTRPMTPMETNNDNA